MQIFMPLWYNINTSELIIRRMCTFTSLLSRMPEPINARIIRLINELELYVHLVDSCVICTIR